MINRSAIIDKAKFLLKIPSGVESINAAEIITRARENLADTIEPYRWSDEQLTGFVDAGIAELKNMRSDVERMESTPDAFTSALANYTVYRSLAIDNDAQNNNGALSDKYMALFRDQANAVQYFFTDEHLSQFADDTVDIVIARRPELRINADGSLKPSVTSAESFDLPTRYTDLIAHGTAARAAIHAKNEQAQYFFEQFNGALQLI